MNNVVIKVDSLGKRYRIGARLKASHSRREALVRALGAPCRYLRSALTAPTEEETLWALRDASFEVQRGEVVGIIGRNGAGKSTLLKILSHITEPTEGRAEIRGRVGSLLEVGTGFHPELTGRENVYLNGAILGMKKAEIRRKFDEIVSFAEVERFIDTPVKRYSSGMFVRLAFAVAAHLEPEIMLVDEVLAVGDVAFRNKCLGKMDAVAREGRTILFVSHNMAAVRNLCGRAMVLDQGRVTCDAAIDEAIGAYLAAMEKTRRVALAEREDRRGSGVLRFKSITFEDVNGRPLTAAMPGQSLRVRVTIDSTQVVDLSRSVIGFGVFSALGQKCFSCSTQYVGARGELKRGRNHLIYTIERLPLAPGKYSINVYAAIGGERADWVQNAASLAVAQGDFFGTGRLPDARNNELFLVDHDIQVVAE